MLNEQKTWKTAEYNRSKTQNNPHNMLIPIKWEPTYVSAWIRNSSINPNMERLSTLDAFQK